MERFFKRKTQSELSEASPSKKIDNSPRQTCVEINVADLPTDPGLRTPIWNYHPNVRDQVRRAYLQKGPCQPRNHVFPLKKFGQKERRFIPSWFSSYPTWLEYSIAKDEAFCLCCYFCKLENGDQSGGDSFVGNGFSNWKKKERLQVHGGGPNSAHKQALRNCEDLLNQKKHIQTVLSKLSDQDRNDYRTRLAASLTCIKVLLRQGLSFRDHDEFENSNNQGNFLVFLECLGDNNEDIRAVSIKNAPENLKLTSPDIQKDIVSAISIEIVIEIIKEIGDSPFSILVDESRDMSSKEQMAIVLRYVDKGCVIERFVAIEHVTDTTALSLKAAIDGFFSRHGLSMSRLRGQGYDGASNMKGEFNGLKILIMKENECAFYIHCFAHQLQLALVAVAKKDPDITGLFTFVATVVNVVGVSAKGRDILRDKHAVQVFKAINNGELLTGQGLNQETTIKRSCDTRWGSHLATLISLHSMFSSVIDVLETVTEDGSTSEQKFQSKLLLTSIQSFDFVFNLHLMKNILGITNDLSQALQRKDQDIVNAMNLVRICKERLQLMRENGWDSLLSEVSSFCGKHQIEIYNMDDRFLTQGRPRRKTQVITNLHHYRVGLFYNAIDMQLQELNNRFTERTTELLINLACLNPSDSFAAFDKQKLICLAKFYPNDFSVVELVMLEDQLENYIMDMRSNTGFSGLKGLTDLAQKMVETKKDQVYPLVYLLLTLALILPVATASVERVFSAMNIVKNRLRNRMGDEWMNDCLIAYIEKYIFLSIDTEVIMQRFQNMKTRRGQL